MGSDIKCHGLLLSFFKRYAFETFEFFEWAGDGTEIISCITELFRHHPFDRCW